MESTEAVDTGPSPEAFLLLMLCGPSVPSSYRIEISEFPTRLSKAATDSPVCQILVEQTQDPTPHQSIPSSPQASPNQMAHPAHPEMLLPETVLPPPPSPPCTCGKVLGDMGPPPDVEEWDNQSIDSHFTAESKGTLESR